MLIEELEDTAAFRAPNGECGWARAQIPDVVATLREHRLAILGGELWWIREDSRGWEGMIPQCDGLPAVYHWESERMSGESWLSYVERCARETLAAVADLPRPGEVPPELPGQILYNLTWVDEAEVGELGSRAV